MSRKLITTVMALALALLWALPAAAQQDDGLAVPYDEVAPIVVERPAVTPALPGDAGGPAAPAVPTQPGVDVAPGVVTPGAQPSGAQPSVVTPASSGLAQTGLEVNVGMALAIALLASGAAALFVAARREHQLHA